MPQWVDLHFDFAISFSQLKLFTSYNYAMRDWTMLAMDSASTHRDTLGVVRGNTSTMRSFNFSPAVKTDVVRILCEKGPSHQSGYARINELALY